MPLSRSSLALATAGLMFGCYPNPRNEAPVETKASPLVAPWGGWLDREGQPPTLVTDPTAPSGGQVQQLARGRSGGDYFSSPMAVTGGQNYCVKAEIKWVGGGTPFVGVKPSNLDAPVWVIGAPYDDVYGPTTVVDASTSAWQTVSRTIVLPVGVTQVQLVNELWEGALKPGSSLSFFDRVSISPGTCPIGSTGIYLEQFESGAGGWADGGGNAATVAADPDALLGQVQVINRNGTGGDYFSPWIDVTGGLSYCVQAKLKWVGGGTPFVGVQLAEGAGPVWVIGSPYTDAFGATTVVNETTTEWQTLFASVSLPADTTKIRIANELYGGVAKAGSPLAYFDGVAVDLGPCVDNPPPPLSVPYLEEFEAGAGGWADGSAHAATLVADPDGLQGQVQAISRNGSAGDYFSPWIEVTGGQSYCVQTKVKWMGGGAPFVGVQPQGADPVWVIGSAYTDVFGPTTVVDATTTAWQTLNTTVVLPADVTLIRLTNELYGGAAKAGSPLAYFDSMAVTGGACTGAVVYLENFESGAGGWADIGHSPATVTADPAGLQGQVQVINRNGSGGDYFSPWIAVGEGTYCVQAKVKWMGGGTPFVGVQLTDTSGPVWVIGSAYTDAFGPTTVVDASTTDWQTLGATVALPAGTTQIRLSNELYGGVSKAGSALAYFDGMSVTTGACSGLPDLPLTVPYLEDFESGPAGWADRDGTAATLAADPDGQMGQVQAIVRGGSGGDYFSRWINVTGGQTYCVKAKVKWLSGACPFVGVQLSDSGWTEWVIGSSYTGALGSTTVVSDSTTGWQDLNHTVVLPAGTTQIRLSDELWAGASKGGSDLAYLDGIGITSGACVPESGADAGVDALVPPDVSPGVDTSGPVDTSVLLDALVSQDADAGVSADAVDATEVPGETCTGTLARGITINEIAVFQTGKISVMKNGAAVTPTTLFGAQIVAGRSAMFRVYVTADSDFQPRALTARLTVNGGGTSYDATASISGSSSELDAANSFLITVPAEQITASLSYSVQIIETGPCSGVPHQPIFPASGFAALSTRTTGIIRVTIVPVTSNGVTATVDQTLVNALKGYMDAMYPTTDTQFTIASAPITGCTISTATAADGAAWEDCLYRVATRRNADNPAAPTYYLGIVAPTSTIYEYCPMGCITGISFIPTFSTDTWSRSSLAIGYLPWAMSTVAHELGHAHSREHAPGCGTSYPDSNYPAAYTVGGIGYIGWVGWDRRTPTSFVNPSTVTDIMGYCDSQWISDYTEKALADRISVSSSMSNQVDPASLRTWRMLRISDGNAKWAKPFSTPTAAQGRAESATILDATGASIAQATVYRTNLSTDRPSSVYMVPEPQVGWAAIQIGKTVVAF